MEVRTGDTIVYCIVDGGDDYGVDAVTPMRWHIGTVSEVTESLATRSRDLAGNETSLRPRWVIRIVPAVRPNEPIHGRLLPAGVTAVLTARGSEVFDGSFAQLTEFVRDMIHDPNYRTAVAREAGF